VGKPSFRVENSQPLSRSTNMLKNDSPTSPGRVKGRNEEINTSEAVIISAFQSTLGKTLNSNLGLISIVSETSSQSLGCSGNELELLLQVFTAHVRKLRVRTFILGFVRVVGSGERCRELSDKCSRNLFFCGRSLDRGVQVRLDQ
jgi:hypothetical protein